MVTAADRAQHLRTEGAPRRARRWWRRSDASANESEKTELVNPSVGDENEKTELVNSSDYNGGSRAW